MKPIKIFVGAALLVISSITVAGDSYASGKVTSLLASGTDPAIRLTGNISPDKCNGGAYGWLYFTGSAEDKNRVYSNVYQIKC